MFQLHLEQNTPLWGLVRFLTTKKRVTASEMGTLFGLNKYRSQERLVNDKRNPPPFHMHKGSFFSEAAANGLACETKAVQLFVDFAERTLVKSLKGYRTDYFSELRVLKPGIVSFPESILACSPDAMYTWRHGDKGDPEGPVQDLLWGIEVKTPFSKSIPQCPEDIDPCHYLQCQASLQVTGADGWNLLYYDHRSPAKSVCFAVHRDSMLGEFMEIYAARLLNIARGKHTDGPLPERMDSFSYVRKSSCEYVIKRRDFP